MKILHVDSERTWRGGEQQVAYLVKGLIARGHECILVAPPGSAIGERLGRNGVDVRATPMRGELDPRAVWTLAAVIRRVRPDIVHMHTAHAHALGVLAAAVAGTGRRVVSRRVDFPIGALSARLKYRRGVDRFIAITEAVASVLAAAGVPRERISIAHSGIDPARLSGADGVRARRSLEVAEGVPLVGCVAHLTWHKGQKYLIRSWPAVRAEVPGARLVLIGHGEDEAMLRQEVEKAGISRDVIFAGFRDDVVDYLAALDCFVLPSVMEGMGTSLLDASALEVPVVATRVGGIPEVIIDGETGLLVPPRDPSALAAAVVRMLTGRGAAQKLATAGRSRVLERFTVDRTVEATLEAYRRSFDRP